MNPKSYLDLSDYVRIVAEHGSLKLARQLEPGDPPSDYSLDDIPRATAAKLVVLLRLAYPGVC